MKMVEIELSDQQFDTLKNLSIECNRSISEILNIAIEQLFSIHEERNTNLAKMQMAKEISKHKLLVRGNPNTKPQRHEDTKNLRLNLKIIFCLDMVFPISNLKFLIFNPFVSLCFFPKNIADENFMLGNQKK